MAEKILIFGNGQIGNLYKDYFANKGMEVSIPRVDITDYNAVEQAIAAFQPTVAINAAAKTSLEWCANNRLEAFNVNTLGADNIAQACDKYGVYYVHISSGCIFQSVDENDEKFEDSPYDPQAFYSWTKVWAEQLIPFHKSTEFKYVILRPRQPISAVVSHRNQLVKMLTFTRFVDTANTGTVLEDMMDWTAVIIEKRATGLYHLANPGWSTPYEIGLMLKDIVNPEMEILKISKEELNKLTPNRRVDTVMNVDKLKSLGIDPKPYRERLKEVIQQLKQNLTNGDPAVVNSELETTAQESAQRTIVNEVWKNLLRK